MKLRTTDLMWWIDEVLREMDGHDHADVDSNPTPDIPGVRIWTKDGGVHVLRLNSAQMQAIMNALRYTLEYSRLRPFCEYNEAKGFDLIDCGKPASHEHTTNTQYELIDGVLHKETSPEHFWLCEEHHQRSLRPDIEWVREIRHNLSQEAVELCYEFQSENV